MAEEIDPVILALRQQVADYRERLESVEKRLTISVYRVDEKTGARELFIPSGNFSPSMKPEHMVAVEVVRSGTPAIMNARPRKSLWSRLLAMLQGGPPVR